MPILYPASNRFKYARSANGFRERRRAIQTPPEDLFSPSLLFSAMEQGAWYDPSDLSTLYQDAAGTTPVTAVEQPVGLMLDKSGRGNHAFQTTATSRPVLKQDANGKYYLFCDGIDDGMVTGTITPGTDKAQVFAGVRKLSDAAGAILVELSANINTNTGSFTVTAPESFDKTYASAARGSGIASVNQQAIIGLSGAAPDTAVLSCTNDIAADLSTIRRNGVAGTSGTGEKGTGNYLAYPLYLFRRGGTTLPFNGHFYGGIIRFGDNLPIETIEQTEAWMAAKTGVTL